MAIFLAFIFLFVISPRIIPNEAAKAQCGVHTAARCGLATGRPAWRAIREVPSDEVLQIDAAE